MVTFPMGSPKTMFWICTFLVYFQQFVDCNSFPSISKLSLKPMNASGPEAFAFDPTGRGPYTGVADGRILKYEDPHVGFVDFATTSPHWTKEKCSGASGFEENQSRICGRPEGLGFDFSSGHLYVVDRYMGFLVVPPSGGLGIQLATGFNGTNFTFPNALDIDQASRTIYFTDVGTIFSGSVIDSGDITGKLYKYNIRTGKLTLLLSGLSGPNGLAVSKDGQFVVISEYGRHRIQRYWLKGPRASQVETLIDLPQRSDNIKRTIDGNFWVGTGDSVQPTSPNSAIAIKFDGSGTILERLDFTSFYDGHSITEANEFLGKSYLGSVFADFVGVVG